jgi:hypothetical protein
MYTVNTTSIQKWKMSREEMSQICKEIQILKIPCYEKRARPGLFKNNGIRLYQRLGSPVQSNKF